MRVSSLGDSSDTARGNDASIGVDSNRRLKRASLADQASMAALQPDDQGAAATGAPSSAAIQDAAVSTGPAAPAPAQAAQPAALPPTAPGAVPAAGVGTGAGAGTIATAGSGAAGSSTVGPSTTDGIGAQPFQLSAVDQQQAASSSSAMALPAASGAELGGEDHAGTNAAKQPLRSSGRHIRPTAKLRQAREMTDEERKASGLGDVGYAFRSRRTAARQSAQGSSGRGSGVKAPRLKLSLKASQAGLGTGQGPKTAPYMQGYTRELDDSDDETGEGLTFEEQLILRFPEGKECDQLREIVRKRQLGEPGTPPVSFKFKDARRAVVRVGDQLFAAKLVDLPTICETHKTLDNKQFFKVADISQMLLVTEKINDESEVGKHVGSMGDLVDPREAEIVAQVKAQMENKAREAGYVINSATGSAISGASTSSTSSTAASGFDSKNFVYPHGITPPMHWARERRFRKVIPRRRGQEALIREVERLVAEDDKAEIVEVDMITPEEAEAELRAQEEAQERGTSGGDAAAIVRRKARVGSTAPSDLDSASNAATPAPGEENMSVMGDEDGSVMDMAEDEGQESENEDVDRDLAAALDAVLDEDGEEDASDIASMSASMSGRQSRAESQIGDEDDDDLFDGNDDEGPSGDEEDEEDEDEDEDNAEMHEFRARQRQLAQEIKDIELLVKRRREEMERHHNALLKVSSVTNAIIEFSDIWASFDHSNEHEIPSIKRSLSSNRKRHSSQT